MFASVNIVNAQINFENYGAKMVGDSLKIWDTNIYTSCGAKFSASISLPKDSIVISELDTSFAHANCSCFFDVNISLTGLTSGNYQIVIYRQELKKYQYIKDTIVFVGSFSFSISGTSGNLPNTKILASDCHQSPVLVEENTIASKYLLLTSYPNPFNPKTTIRYSIPETEIVSLKVYDDVGRIVTTLVNEKKSVGEYSVQFDGTNLGSGIYICRLVVGKNVLTNKLALLK